MAMVTTVKPISLGYREVGSQGNYVPLMGVLKGLSISQDEPDSTEVEAEFYDSPFDIFYEGNPVTMTFELANYDLEELTNLFGGEIADSIDYESETNAYTSEWEWRLNFSRGNSALVIYRGLTIGTIKKDADGALNYSVTITAIVYNDGNNDHIYKIVGKPWVNPYPNAVLYIDDDMKEEPIPVTEFVTCGLGFDHIVIDELPENINITATANGENSPMIQDVYSWRNVELNPDTPFVVYENGKKWFTVITDE